MEGLKSPRDGVGLIRTSRYELGDSSSNEHLPILRMWRKTNLVVGIKIVPFPDKRSLEEVPLQDVPPKPQTNLNPNTEHVPHLVPAKEDQEEHCLKEHLHEVESKVADAENLSRLSDNSEHVCPETRLTAEVVDKIAKLLEQDDKYGEKRYDPERHPPDLELSLQHRVVSQCNSLESL